MTAVYATIWLSLGGLLLAELGRRRHRQSLAAPWWAVGSSAAGVTLGVIHSALALAVAYDWDHARAAAVAAERAGRIYGVPWSGSVYVNYVFLAWWAADTAWWWRSPQRFIHRAAWIEWLWRLLVVTMVANSAVVFASDAGRVAGVPLLAGFVWIWLSAGIGAEREHVGQ